MVIRTELSSSDISKGSLFRPPESSDPLDDVNYLLKSTKQSQGIFTNALKSRIPVKANPIEKSKGNSSLSVAALKSHNLMNSPVIIIL
jgi:hypothetical protein